MRSSTIFFIIGLVALASATSTQDAEVFAQLEQHPFGQTMLDLVQINMQSNSQTEISSEDSFSQITDLLQSIQADMISNRKAADLAHKSFQENIKLQIDSITKTLNEQRATRIATKQQLANDKESLKNTQNDLAAAQTHLAQVVLSIKNADAENIRAIAAFEKKVRELQEAIQACKDAVGELAKLNVGSFVEGQSINMLQIQGGMKKVEDVLKLHLPARLTIYKPIISALVDMGTNADPVLVSKVNGLINELRGSLEAELASSIKAEKTRLADYTKLRADLVTDQTNTNARIGRDLTQIKSLETNIKQLEGVLVELNRTIPLNEQLLAVKIAEKNTEQNNYERDNAIRVDELKVMTRLVTFFQEKLNAGVSSYLRGRVALVEKRQI